MIDALLGAHTLYVWYAVRAMPSPTNRIMFGVGWGGFRGGP
eukprot:COSAG01_NODE_60334_length_295_cov_1.040816_1_plen_40_part_10